MPCACCDSTEPTGTDGVSSQGVRISICQPCLDLACTEPFWPVDTAGHIQQDQLANIQ